MSMNSGSGGFEPREAAQILLRRKWLLIVPTILVTAIAFGGSYFIPPKYESSSLVWIGNPVKLTRDLQRMIGQFQDIVLPQRNARQDIRTYAHQIASRQYAQQVMDNMDFADDEEVQQRIQRMAATQPDMTPRDLQIAIVRGRLASDIKLDFVTNSHLQISARSEDPYEARDMAQTVGEIFVKEQANEELKSIYLSLNFSSDLLERYETELKAKRDEKTQLEKDIAKWQSGNPLADEANRSDLTSEIERRNQEIEDLRDRETAILASLDRVGQGDFKIDEPRKVRQKKQQVVDLVESVENLLQEYAWKNPAIDNLALRIIDLEDDIEDEHARLVAEQFPAMDNVTRAEITRLQNTRHRRELLGRLVTALESGLEKLDSKRASIPEYRATLEQLDREVKAIETLRDQFKVQLEGFEISQELVEETRFQIVENARLQPTPVWPDRQVILGIGLMLGLIIGGAGIFVVEYSDRSLKDADTAEGFLGQSVIGVVPKIEQLS